MYYSQALAARHKIIYQMDTDDLSEETYNGIIREAEKFHHDLTLQFGLLSSECSTENEYLEHAIELIKEFKTYKTKDLVDIFYDRPPDLKSFKQILRIIENNIYKIKEVKKK
jgi:hypothetical protein